MSSAQQPESVVGEASQASPTESAPVATLYVDEAAGSDETGDGTESSPLKSAIAALERVSGATVAIKVRKPAEGDAAAEWQDISGAGLKKARKGYETAVAKKKKAEEAAKKLGDDKAKAEEEERRRIEESKKIRLEQDPSLPAAEKVRRQDKSIEDRRARRKFRDHELPWSPFHLALQNNPLYSLCPYLTPSIDGSH